MVLQIQRTVMGSSEKTTLEPFWFFNILMCKDLLIGNFISLLRFQVFKVTMLSWGDFGTPCYFSLFLTTPNWDRDLNTFGRLTKQQTENIVCCYINCSRGYFFMSWYLRRCKCKVKFSCSCVNLLGY